MNSDKNEINVEKWAFVLTDNGGNYFRLALANSLLLEASYNMVYQASSEEFSIYSNKHHSTIVGKIMDMSKEIDRIMEEVKEFTNYNPDILEKRNLARDQSIFSLGETQLRMELIKSLLEKLLDDINSKGNRIKPSNNDEDKIINEAIRFLENLNEKISKDHTLQFPI